MVGCIGACILWRYDMEMSLEGKHGSHGWREYCSCGKYRNDTLILKHEKLRSP
jgi:hypothetical protein